MIQNAAVPNYIFNANDYKIFQNYQEKLQIILKSIEQNENIRLEHKYCYKYE